MSLTSGIIVGLWPYAVSAWPFVRAVIILYLFLFVVEVIFFLLMIGFFMLRGRFNGESCLSCGQFFRYEKLFSFDGGLYCRFCHDAIVQAAASPEAMDKQIKFVFQEAHH